MGGLATVLASLVGPLAKRVLVALGIGIVSYAGATAALNGALGAASAAFGGMTGATMQIMAMAGGFQAVAIIAGGLTAGVAFSAVKKMMLISGT